MVYSLLPRLWNLQLWKHTAASTAKGTAAGRESLAHAAPQLFLQPLCPSTPKPRIRWVVFAFKAKHASDDISMLPNMSATHQHHGNQGETISWMCTQSALEESQAQNTTQHVTPEVAVQRPVGFPRLSGPFTCQSDPLPVSELWQTRKCLETGTRN